MRHDHRLAKRKKLSWKDTVDERYISVAKSSGNRSVLDAALAGVEKHPWISCEINHVSGILALVESGLGVAAVPGLSILPERQGTVVGVPLVNPAVKRTLGLISRHQHAMPPASRTLFEMMSASIGKQGRRA
jgi:DNA-binding transcriptional LysR family regulator